MKLKVKSVKVDVHDAGAHHRDTHAHAPVTGGQGTASEAAQLSVTSSPRPVNPKEYFKSLDQAFMFVFIPSSRGQGIMDARIAWNMREGPS